MTQAIFEGLLMGLFLSVFIGPVFFLLIDTSIKKGIKEAFIMDAGVILSDIAWIVLLWWGMDKYLGFFLNSSLAMIFAGIVFSLFGISGLIIKNRKRLKRTGVSNKNLFLQGFFLNTINPSVALFWLATITLAMKRFDRDQDFILIFFIAIFITVALIDSFKFFTANRLGAFLNERRQNLLSIITHLLMLIFGIYMIISNSF
jgi:threonine/homoserine/homoserine lactone efflux protein